MLFETAHDVGRLYSGRTDRAARTAAGTLLRAEGGGSINIASLIIAHGKVNRKSQHPELFEGCEVLVYTAHLDLAINSATAINFVDRLNEAGIQAEHIQLENTHQEVPKIVYTDKAVQEWIWLVDPGNEKGPEERPVP